MLQEAQRLHQQGIDVLAGVVETHSAKKRHNNLRDYRYYRH